MGRWWPTQRHVLHAVVVFPSGFFTVRAAVHFGVQEPWGTALKQGAAPSASMNDGLLQELMGKQKVSLGFHQNVSGQQQNPKKNNPIPTNAWLSYRCSGGEEERLHATPPVWSPAAVAVPLIHRAKARGTRWHNKKGSRK